MRLAIGLVMTLAALAVAGRRVHYLYRLIRSGQPAPGRLDGIGQRAKDQLRRGVRPAQAAAVVGPRRWRTSSRSGRFIVLAATILEAYGALFDRDFAIPLIGHWRAARASSRTSSPSPCWSRWRVHRRSGCATRRPAEQRASRFYGSHTGAAWLVLLMIFNVIWTLLLYRGAQINTGVLPVQATVVAFASQAVANVLEPLGKDANERPGDGRHPAADRGRARLPGAGRLLQAPAHLPRAAQRAHQARAQRARPAAADHGRRQADRLREPRRARRGHRRSAAARSRTSPGRGCSTSRPAPSAGAARTSARPGTPASRCRPSS